MLHNRLKMSDFTIGIVISDTETIIQEVKNHDTIESVMDFMLNNFGNNNYFIKHYTELRTNYYKVYKGKLSKIGNNDFTNDVVGNYYIGENYPQFFDNEDCPKLLDKFNYNLSVDIINILYNKYPKKKITIDKWKFKIMYVDLHNAFVTDKTPTKKYTDWLCRLHWNKNVLSEDSDKITNLLLDFDKPEVKTLIKKSGHSLDINDYQLDTDLFQVVTECYYDKLTELELKDTKKLLEARIIFENEYNYIVVPQSHEESIKLSRFGGMTYWCTAADSVESSKTYDNYTDYGKEHLVIFINKQDNSKKFQWSTGKGDFLNQDDDDFEPIELYVDKYSLFEICDRLLFKFGKIPKKLNKILFKDYGILFESDFNNNINHYNKNSFIQNLSEAIWLNNFNSLDLTGIKIYNNFFNLVSDPHYLFKNYLSDDNNSFDTKLTLIKNLFVDIDDIEYIKNITNELNLFEFEFEFKNKIFNTIPTNFDINPFKDYDDEAVNGLEYKFLMFFDNIKYRYMSLIASKLNKNFIRTNFGKYFLNEFKNNDYIFKLVMSQKNVSKLTDDIAGFITGYIYLGLNLDEFLEFRNITVLKRLSRLGYGLDKLINSPYPAVREDVIFEGYMEGFNPDTEENQDVLWVYYDNIDKIKGGHYTEKTNKYGYKYFR